MAGEPSNITQAEDDGSHTTTVDVGTGQNIVLDDFYSWPTFLVRAERATGQELLCIQSASNEAPTLSNLATYTKGAEGGGRRVFGADELQHVKDCRKSAPVGKLKLSQDATKNHNVYGWMYGGLIPKGVPDSLGTGPKGSMEYAKGQVWLEIMSEGGVAAINAYDVAKFSWGQGWALKGGLLFSVMDPIFSKPKYGALRRALLDHGISWDPTPKSPKERGFVVVNDDGYMETGMHAMNLIQGSPEILASFIKVGEAADTTQLLLDAEAEAFSTTPAGKVPVWALNWEDDLIRFVAHIGHGRSIDAWQDPGASTIREFLLAWANRSKSSAAPAWKERGSGALTANQGSILVTFLQQWGASVSGRGRGIAWKAVSAVCPTPISVSVAELDDPANKSRFGGLLFFPSASVPEGKNTKSTYYVYPSLPPGMSSDDELYEFATKVNGYSITDILKEAEKLKGKAKTYRDLYNPEGSSRTVGSYGYRTRVALDAALAHAITSSVQTRDKAAHALYQSAEFQELKSDQQDLIRAYLKTKTTVWSFWDDGDKDRFISSVNPYSMSALVNTLGQRNYATVDSVRQHYEAQGKPYGWRLWIAAVAVCNRGGGQAAGWIATHPGYKEMPGPQQAIIAKTVGLPYDASIYDPKG